MEQNQMDELRIIMVGTSGVGKTSLLAAMHEEFNKTFKQANLEIWPEETRTSMAIDECKLTLKNIDPRLKKSVAPSIPLERPWDDEGFLFGIGSGDKKFIKLRFTDPSGEYFKPGAKPEYKQYVEKQLNDCDAVIIPVDATALMETKTGKVKGTEIGTWHEEINEPDRITALLKNAYENLQHPRLVILAPVKCESYMRNPRDANDLLDRVKMGYRELLEFFKQESLIKNLAVVVTPVQTIGNVQFAYHQVNEDGKTRFYYHKTPINAPYAPRYGEQPLRYVLRFLLNVFAENKKKSLEQQQENLAILERDLGQKKEELETAEKQLERQKEKFEQRQEMWWLFRSIANIFDDRESAFYEAKYEYNNIEGEVQDTSKDVRENQAQVEATQAQIDAFNSAIFTFALDCKRDDGFAILQGAARWLPIPKN
ncbi:MAG: hypothetical protein F6K54_32170 [Okeania sp. SIO3B5]|uniref:TRAFAC clade GTPase domain-containing protein n=1 Tax=Okeania sp. SIO3B5 TaxID=2607811 RepID=UPI0013FFDDC4|nr:hypothetical protein [Okeania sp. SIO3B5]NEO57323.1 hypothetical protein [Okeania sp. SIO3B5]